jgi:membrane protease YdiL (CAAX protease family)
MALAFVCLALGFAVCYWLLVTLSRQGMLPFSMSDSIVGTTLKGVLRDFGPLIAATLVAALYQGGAGLKQLWRSVGRFRAPGKVYLLASIGPFIAAGITVAIGLMTGSISRSHGPISAVHFALLFPIMAVIDGPLGEEVGWRGLLLPQLLGRMEPFRASIVVGCVWWLWHIPLYLADGRVSTAGAWIEFLVSTLALSVIFTWFFLKSKSSTFITILLHTTTNFSIFVLLLNVFHKVGTSTIPTYTYDSILVFAAIAAAASFRRWRTY